MSFSLAQTIFNISPGWLKTILFELDEDEQRFLEVAAESRAKILHYNRARRGFIKLGIKNEAAYQRMTSDSEQRAETLKTLLRGQDGKRFHDYFSKIVDSCDLNYKRLFGYYN